MAKVRSSDVQNWLLLVHQLPPKPTNLRVRIWRKLQQLGAVVAYSGADETALIEQFLQRKFRGKNLGALLQEDKHLASAFRRLRTAGFSAGGSIKVLKRYAAEAERLEEMGEEERPE